MLRFVLALYILMANGIDVPGAVLAVAWCMVAFKYIAAPALLAIGKREKGGWGCRLK